MEPRPLVLLRLARRWVPYYKRDDVPHDPYQET